MPPVLHLTAFLWVLSATVHSYYFFYSVECRTLGSPQNIEVLISLVYNKGKVLTYNSTENEVVAYSEYGAKWAKDFNSKTHWLHSEAEKVVSECREYGGQLSPVDKAVRPRVMLRSLRPASGDQPAVLMCSAYDFYPKPIKLTWLRGREKVTADVVSTEELTNGDWYYQVHSQLEFTPEPAEDISCMVEHLSFREPALFHWSHSDEASLSESDRDRIAVGAAALLLGGVTALTGLIYYKRKLTGWTSVQVLELGSRTQ
ncbi:hypothetical protein SRHO_G00329380 [Serrasalmus rhombeus]